MELPRVITWVVRVSLWGVMPRPLVMTYSTADPVAVRLEVNGRHWSVARRRLLDALGPAQQVLDDDGDEGAAAVQISRLPGVCGEHLRLMVRTPCGYWPMTLSAECLAEFLAQTCVACPLSRERHLVEVGLAGQLELLAGTQGGQR